MTVHVHVYYAWCTLDLECTCSGVAMYVCTCMYNCVLYNTFHRQPLCMYIYIHVLGCSHMCLYHRCNDVLGRRCQYSPSSGFISSISALISFMM